MSKVIEYSVLVARIDRLETETQQLQEWIINTPDTQSELFQYKSQRYREGMEELRELKTEIHSYETIAQL